MGDEQSKPEGAQGQHGAAGDADAHLSPSQRGFGQGYKCTKRENFPLLRVPALGAPSEFQYMDTRTAHPLPGATVPEGQLHYEMFWSGEAAGLDNAKFKEIVGAELAKYGAVVAGDLREAGCMISMVAVPFNISEASAMELGHAIYSDFGNPPTEPPK